jgi:hypothetical protein
VRRAIRGQMTFVLSYALASHDDAFFLEETEASAAF